MSKFTTTTYGNRKQIHKFPDHYVNLAVTVDNTGITANAEGKKIVPAGTILGNGILTDQTKLAKKQLLQPEFQMQKVSCSMMSM